MVNYESLLLGGMEHSMPVKKTTGGKMTHEDRLRNLEKARAVRASNLAKKKKMEGKGQYNQDYVDESQINYAGSPLDMYYLGTQKDAKSERQQRGEIGEGVAKRGRKPKKVMVESESEDEEETYGGRVKCGGDMKFMKGSMHTGMSMPTEAQYKNGGKIKKGKKKVSIEDISGGEINIPDAIKTLAVLASKFNLKLVKM